MNEIQRESPMPATNRDVLSLVRQLKNIGGRIEIDDGVLSIEGTQDTVWRGLSDRMRTLEQYGVNVVLTNHDGIISFKIHYRDSFSHFDQSRDATATLTNDQSGASSIDVFAVPNHPAYPLVAEALREAISVGKGAEVKKGIRGLQSKIARALRPHYAEPLRGSGGGSHGGGH